MKRLIISLVLAAQATIAWPQSISGIVQDSETKAPLVGANVLIEGTSHGVTTDDGGRFVLPSSFDKGVMLTISYVGYRAQSVIVNEPSLVVNLDSHFTLEEVAVTGVRADENIPITSTNLDRKSLEKVHYGQDPVFSLERLSPSILSHSESGTNFVNYAQMRLRGIDQTRINITLNGVPLNDMVDQGVFFSNFNDLVNSIESTQIQRGVGTSTNGTASYAGSINFESIRLMQPNPSSEIQLMGGSFNTFQLSGEVHSGQYKEKFAFYSRFTKTLSDGYKFNSGTNSNSFFFSGGFFGDHDYFKLTSFIGRTRNDLAYLPVWIEDIKSEPRTNYLNPNDVDDFGQQLVQMQHTHWFENNLSLTSSAYYGGAGGDFPFGFDDANGNFTQINFPLTNQHWGFMSSLASSGSNTLKFKSGLHLNTFIRRNEESVLPDKENPYYQDRTIKNELSAFGNLIYQLNRINLYTDLQIRYVNLHFTPDLGFLSSSGVDIPDRSWTFLNPKIGVGYDLNSRIQFYASYGSSSREPTRTDILGSTTINQFNLPSVLNKNSVKEEVVHDFEIGSEFSGNKLNGSVNLFFMKFNNEIAPIGAFIPAGFVQLRKNIKNSYRTGVEISWSWDPSESISFSGNLSYIDSKIESFTPEGGSVTYSDVQPIISPEWMTNLRLTYQPVSWLSGALMFRSVSKSFLELTNQPNLVMPDFGILNSQVIIGPLKHYQLSIQINNITDETYFTNGAPVDVDFDGIFDGPGFLVQPPRSYFMSIKMTF